MATSGYFETNISPIEGPNSTDPKSVGTEWSATYISASMQWEVTWISRAKGSASHPSRWTTIQNGTTSFSSSYTMDPASPSATMSHSVDAVHNQELLRGTFRISINSNGDASFTASMRYHVNSSSDNPTTGGLCTASQTFNLDNVPLASTISAVSSLNVTSTSVSLSYSIISKANYWHQLSYGISENTATVKLSSQNVNATTFTGTISASEILAKFPSVESGTLYLYLKTYKEQAKTNQVGQTQLTPITINISKNGSGIQPTITLGNVSINSSPISGYLVAGYSSAKATVSGACPAASGSSISKITYTITPAGGTTTNGTINSSSGTITSSTLPASTSTSYQLTISATAYDARGGSATASKTGTVYGYKVPVISATAYRTSASSGSSPARDDAGGYVYVSYSASQSYTVNGSNSISSTTCTASGSISGSKSSGSFTALALDGSATFTFTSTDNVTSTSTSITITPAKFALELYDNKNGTLKAITGGTLYANGITGSSWIDAQKDGQKAAIRVGDATNTSAAWPWISGKNTSSGKSFAIAQLGSSLYFIGSDTSRTTNGYDRGFIMDFSNGVFTAPSFSGTVSYATSAGSATSATTASSCSGNAATASAVKDAGNNNSITLQYSGSGISSATWFCVWNGYKIDCMNAANMRSNLGLGVTRLYSGSLTSKNATCTVNDVTNYKFLIAGGYAYNVGNQAQTNVFIAVNELSSTAKQYIVSDDVEGHYVRFSVTLSGSTATFKIESISGSGAAFNAVYGVN